MTYGCVVNGLSSNTTVPEKLLADGKKKKNQSCQAHSSLLGINLLEVCGVIRVLAEELG